MQLAVGDVRHGFVRKIRPRRQMCRGIGQCGAHRVDSAGEHVLRARLRRTGGQCALRADALHHGFRRGEAHFAVEEGAAGEFPGLRHPRTGRQCGAQHAAGEVDAAVARQLHAVLAGVAARRAEYRGDAVVERAGIVGQLAVVRAVARRIAQARTADRAEDAVGNRHCAAAADPDDADGAGRLRRCDGGDGGGLSRLHGTELLWTDFNDQPVRYARRGRSRSRRRTAESRRP